MARPFWSGQIRISLVSFGVKLFPATEAKSEIHFHQIDRKSGERIHHQNVSADAPVKKQDIVKGYEYKKGEYVQIDPDEIAHLRIPSRHILEMQQFVDLDELDPAFFEKPYFLVPDKNSDSEAFSVVRKALEETGKAGLGKIAVGGREHLIAVAPPPDPKLRGLTAYVLRYADELRDPAQYFADIKSSKVNAESLSLARDLIERKTAKFEPSRFHDDYETALRELVKARIKHLPLPLEEKPAPRGKVINLMDALRRSVHGSEEGKAPARATSSKSRQRSAHHGLKIVPEKSRAAVNRRKTA